ncbi:MAG TPA: efflux RND transporter periplasmic adaptor subunit [Planctomycetaceae bacterium]|nr:efflux RND transporter periplasmic adaptor subunit [Planctomycetaceae bacterium]
MRRLGLFVLLLVVIGAAAGATWWFNQHEASATELKLFGNVDLRQVQLAFNNNERITEVLVQEGDRVTKGQVLARVDTRRIEPQVAQAEASANAQRAVVDRLHHGNRPEEIAEAKANMEAAKADSANARVNYERMKNLFDRSHGEAISQQDFDNAKAAAESNEAKFNALKKALEVWILGPRKEEVAENEAKLKADEAQLAYLRQQLIDTQLIAPADSIVRTRLMEPGDMASPTKPVFSLAVINPKWVRAYVSEVNLGKVREGMPASIEVDSFPNRRFEGWIGFVSPIAEFTPKAVQTEELRTSLVYEVRAFVKDPKDELPLGMPATVYLPLGGDTSKAPQAPGSSAPSAPTKKTPAEKTPATAKVQP